MPKSLRIEFWSKIDSLFAINRIGDIVRDEDKHDGQAVKALSRHVINARSEDLRNTAMGYIAGIGVTDPTLSSRIFEALKDIPDSTLKFACMRSLTTIDQKLNHKIYEYCVSKLEDKLSSEDDSDSATFNDIAAVLVKTGRIHERYAEKTVNILISAKSMAAVNALTSVGRKDAKLAMNTLAEIASNPSTTKEVSDKAVGSISEIAFLDIARKGTGHKTIAQALQHLKDIGTGAASLAALRLELNAEKKVIADQYSITNIPNKNVDALQALEKYLDLYEDGLNLEFDAEDLQEIDWNCKSLSARLYREETIQKLIENRTDQTPQMIGAKIREQFERFSACRNVSGIDTGPIGGRDAERQRLHEQKLRQIETIRDTAFESLSPVA